MFGLWQFSGRASRRTYRLWMFGSMTVGMIVIATFVTGVVSGLIPESFAGPLFGVMFVILGIGGGLQGFSIQVRRLHDLDRPASDMFTDQLDAIRACFMDSGSPGANQYGDALTRG